MNTMSWPISGAAALLLAALVAGCDRPPARQGAGVSFAPIWLPNQLARSPHRQVQVASAAAVADYDHDISRAKDVATEPAPTPTELARDELLDVALDLGVSSVRYAEPLSSTRPSGMLSIADVALDFDASTRDAATDAIDALARRLSWSADPQK